MTATELARRLGATRSGRGWMARCPAHDDRRASLSIGVGDDGRRVLLRCHAGCAYDAIVAAAGLEPGDLRPAGREDGRVVRRWEIRDVDGTVRAIHERIDQPGRAKRLCWRRADGTPGLGGVRTADLPLYLAHRLGEWAGQPVVVTEGEPAADALIAAGVAAVGTVTGASGTPSDATLRALLRAPTVIVWPDADAPGREHMARVAARLRALGHRDVRIVAWADAPAGGDAADYRGDVRALLAAARPIAATPGAPTETAEREAQIAAAVERERVRREARRRVDAETRPQYPPPEILTLREYRSRPQPAITERIARAQPVASRVMLVAPAKTGKTTLVGSIVRALVDGGLALDALPVRPVEGTVVILDAEMSPRQLIAWLADQAIRHDDRVIPIALRGRIASLDLLDVDVRRQWADRLRAVGAQYLVLDCLRPVLDALGLDEHREAGRLLVALDALLAEAGIPEALVVHHMGHGGERARGDSRLRDWPDVEWRLVRREDDPTGTRYLRAYGRDVDLPESALEYDPTTRRLRLVGGSRRDAELDEALAAIVEVLADSGRPLSARAILAELRDAAIPRDQIRRALAAGIRAGRITVSEGPRRAHLHALSPSARECAASARRTHPDQCASGRPPMGGDTTVAHSLRPGCETGPRTPAAHSQTTDEPEIEPTAIGGAHGRF